MVGEVVAVNRDQPQTVSQVRLTRARDNAAGKVEVAGAWARKQAAAEGVGRALPAWSRKVVMNRKGCKMMTEKTQIPSWSNAIDSGPLRILLASDASQRLESLAASFKKIAETELFRADSTAEVLELLKIKDITLVVVDEELRDTDGLTLVKMLARQHPFVSCVLVSLLPADEFHEETEGLGVLMHLPSPPGTESAQSILEHLSAIDATRTVSR